MKITKFGVTKLLFGLRAWVDCGAVDSERKHAAP